jgi:hypothetical protein
MTTQSTPLEAVLARLDVLERRNECLARENRWLKGVGAAVVGVAGLAVLLGRAPTGEAAPQKRDDLGVSRSFVIRDENGKTRVALGIFQGQPGLYLYDDQERERARVNLQKDGPALNLYDEDGKRRAKLFLDGGEPGLVFADGKEQSRVNVGTSQEETFLGLYDQRGRGRVLLQGKGAKTTLSLGGGIRESGGRPGRGPGQAQPGPPGREGERPLCPALTPLSSAEWGGVREGWRGGRVR